MKNKLIIILMLMVCCASISKAETISPELSDAIQKYKAQNYVGCMQDAIEITKNDPANALAFYYLGISYVKLGDKDKAIDAYHKVIALSTSDTLSEYAERGLLCLSNPEECKSSKKTEMNERFNEEYHKFINSTKTISKDVSDKLDEIQIEIMKQKINKEADETSAMPTNDEIAEAVKTLAKIGVNPLTTQNNAYIQAQQALNQNPEYMQLQMLLGNNQNNNNDFMSMLPYFMPQNGTKKNNLSEETLKNMMMSSMIGNLSTTFDFNDK